MLRWMIMGLLATAFCSPLAAAQSRTLATLIADYEKLDRAFDPVTSSQEGDILALSRLPDVSREAAFAHRASLDNLRTRLLRIQPKSLRGEDVTNHALMLLQIEQRMAGIDLDADRIVFENDSGFHTFADGLARTTPVRTLGDADAWIARLEALPKFYADNILNARRGVASGFTQPKIVIDRVLDTARIHAAMAPEDSALLKPLASTEFSAQRARAIVIIRDKIQPAQADFVRFLETEYLPAARPALGIRTVPGGEAFYRYAVKRHTTTDMTPEQIHALGQGEVARIRGEMDQIIADLKFEGDFAAFQAFLRTDPQFYAKTPEDLLEKASEIAKRADDQLPGLFGKLPRLPYGVRPVPDDVAEGYTTGRYWSGSPQLGVAGGYMVNTHRLEQRPLYELPALTLHEAVPGHHLQIALSQELDALPYFRRNSSVTAFVEGWGLYAETLGTEMGIYRTPYERFGKLSYEMWRACRLVADTGIHWMGWSLPEARRCFDENSALSPHNITTELERYVSWPGQALAYKIGELTLRRLRAEAEDALGPQFDVRAFHDLVLGAGALPMSVLETRVRSWITEQTGARR